MAVGSQVTLLQGTTGNGWQTAATLVTSPVQRGVSNTLSRSRTPPERTGREQGTADVHMTLQKAAVAATRAAERAFASVDALEEALRLLAPAVGVPARGHPPIRSPPRSRP